MLVRRDEHRLEIECPQPVEQVAAALLVLIPGAGLPRPSAGRDRRRPHLTGGLECDHEPADVGVALLPDGILDDDRHDLPAALSAQSQSSRTGSARKSERTKTKGAGGQVARVLDQGRRPARDRVAGRANGRSQLEQAELALAARRMPERRRLRPRRSSRAGRAPRRAVADQADALAHRLGLVEPRPRLAEAGIAGRRSRRRRPAAPRPRCGRERRTRLPRAVESRADADQSIAADRVAGLVGPESAITSLPCAAPPPR